MEPWQHEEQPLAIHIVVVTVKIATETGTRRSAEPFAMCIVVVTEKVVTEIGY